MDAPTDRHPPARFGRFARAVTVTCAIGYPVALAAIALAFRYIGEQWWVTLTAMYLPRAGFALPLPFVVAALVIWGPRKLLALQALATLVLLFPLMGLNLGLGRLAPEPAGPAVSVFSFNVKYAKSAETILANEIRRAGADIVLLQAAPESLLEALKKVAGPAVVRRDGEFILATRFPVRAVYDPPDLQYVRGPGGAHYVEYTIDTPLGLVDVFNVHTTSPRPGFEEVRGAGLREEILSGRLIAGTAGETVGWNAYRRTRQIAGAAARAGSSRNAVIVAGDTNLPGLSRILGEHLGRFRDAFSGAGFGFGYTYPAKLPWMRIDRILTNERLTAVDFRIGPPTRSDHLSVVALIKRAG